MKHNKTTVPILRFPEFNELWIERKLSEICISIKDGTHGSFKDEVSEYYLLSAKNIKEGELFLSKNERTIDLDDFQSIMTSQNLESEDILLTIVGTIGRVALMTNDKNIVFQRSVALLKLRDCKPYFIYTLLQSSKVQNSLSSISVMSAQSGIYLNELTKLKIYLPSITEQIEISKLFILLDERIKKQEKVVYNLEILKKGYMQKIFTQELRFTDENGEDFPDWEEHRLTDISDVKTGSSDVQDAISNGKYPFFDRGANIKLLNTFEYDNEAIIYAGEGSEFLPRYFNGKYALHQRCYTIHNINNANLTKYLFYLLETKNSHFISTAVGTTVRSLRMNSFSSLMLKLPTKQEQEKVVLLFDLIDEKINLEKEIFKNLKLLKLGYLQKMFI